jgi:Prp8 binding protein
MKKWIAHEESTILTLLRIDDDTFASGGADSKIRIFSVKEDREIGVLSGHEDWVWKLDKINEDTIVSCSEDGTIRIWNYKNSQQLTHIKHTCSVQTLTYNKNKNHLYIGDLTGTLSCIDLTTNNITWSIKAH